LQRELEIKEDGRYIVFYEFEESGRDSAWVREEGGEE
jgi:hypothetical protein